MSKKHTFLAIVGALSLWGAVLPAWAVPETDFHGQFFALIPDWISAGFRALTAAVKYFLGDDTALVAELVWDDSSSSGGCGGCYGGKPSASADLKLSASLEDISLSEDVYGTKGYVAQSTVTELTEKIIKDIMREKASLDQLSEEGQRVYYKAQQRSIQAMTDALMMKKAYVELKGIVAALPTDFSNYSAAASSIASRRLILDELLALKKRVIAARLRTKAQTMEIDSINTEALTVPPELPGGTEDEPKDDPKKDDEGPKDPEKGDDSDDVGVINPPIEGGHGSGNLPWSHNETGDQDDEQSVAGSYQAPGSFRRVQGLRAGQARYQSSGGVDSNVRGSREDLDYKK